MRIKEVFLGKYSGDYSNPVSKKKEEINLHDEKNQELPDENKPNNYMPEFNAKEYIKSVKQRQRSGKLILIVITIILVIIMLGSRLKNSISTISTATEDVKGLTSKFNELTDSLMDKLKGAKTEDEAKEIANDIMGAMKDFETQNSDIINKK